ncbi:alpha/beta fold hydrolase [Jongsikchunia kroppenstedtii]|uniref:alpha/beta fold hydrolase n=1 Tax=Jongsikchunia kroppenstedtii TaxID=1121721 RepID=UPI00037FEC75|nr:alpha/beta hydrolase [Jongsikchunia kroppenstedtii]
MVDALIDDYFHSPEGIEFCARYRAAWSTADTNLSTTVIESDWARTHITCAGDANDDAILLLSGSGATSAAWAHAVGPLTKAGYQVIAPDIPGEPGLSVRHEALAAVPDLSAWLGDLLDQMRIRRVTLVGHSYGAMVATACAVGHPERVAKLVLLDPNSVFSPIAPRAALRAIPLLCKPNGRRLRSFYNWETRGVALDPTWMYLAEYAADSFPARRPLVPRKLDLARLNILAQPVSVILAEHSRYHDPKKVYRAVLDVVPTAHVVTIAGASHHMLPLQPAPDVNNAIMAALDG